MWARGLAPAAGELAQPGRDGLLVAQRLAPAGGARLARRDRVRRLPRAAGTLGGRRVGGCRRWVRTAGPAAFEGHRHRARTYPTSGGLSTPNGCARRVLLRLSGEATKRNGGVLQEEKLPHAHVELREPGAIRWVDAAG